MYIERKAHHAFLSACQTRRGVVGGLAKTPGTARDGGADPYHTYLALAALALYPVDSEEEREKEEGEGTDTSAVDESWRLEMLNALLNATEKTAEWVKAKMPVPLGGGR